MFILEATFCAIFHLFLRPSEVTSVMFYRSRRSWAA